MTECGRGVVYISRFCGFAFLIFHCERKYKRAWLWWDRDWETQRMEGRVRLCVWFMRLNQCFISLVMIGNVFIWDVSSLTLYFVFILNFIFVYLFCVHTNLMILAPCSPLQIAKHLKKQKQESFIILSAVVKINLPYFHPLSVNTYVYMLLYYYCICA